MMVCRTYVQWVVGRGSSWSCCSGEDRWPSEGGYLDLAGEEVRFFSCSKYGMCCMVLAYLL